MCQECYVDERRCTSLLNSLVCLEKHTQYICGTCGRNICIECDLNEGYKGGLFHLKALKLLRCIYVQLIIVKKRCVIYRIENNNGELLIRFLVVLVI